MSITTARLISILKTDPSKFVDEFNRLGLDWDVFLESVEIELDELIELKAHEKRNTYYGA